MAPVAFIVFFLLGPFVRISLAFLDLNNSVNLSTGRGEARDGPEAVKVTASGLQAAAIQLLRLNHSQNNRDKLSFWQLTVQPPAFCAYAENISIEQYFNRSWLVRAAYLPMMEVIIQKFGT